MAGVGDEWYFVESSGSDTEHLVPISPDGELGTRGLCGADADSYEMNTLGERVESPESVYDMLRSDYACASCRHELLRRLGLPDTAEEANERVGREVF